MTDRIKKFKSALSSQLRKRINQAIEAIKSDPYNHELDAKKLKGSPYLYRVRIGKIRIIYKINEDKTGEIMDIDFRGNVY